MNFIVVTDTFDDRSGGLVVLHLLCQRLTEAGETAFLWPMDRPRLQPWRQLRRYLGWARYHLTKWKRPFSKGPFATKLAKSRDLAGAVVIYPEVIAGNPLAAHNVVRWLLHKPGFHTQKADYGKDDLFFYYQDAFYDPSFGDYEGNRLTITWLNSEYRQFNHEPRTGSCYLLKKGQGRPIAHDLTDSVLIDSLSTREKVEVFNRTKYFYSYDLYTFYARYAAICGCIPIFVPLPGLAREEWVARETERYGLAYGEEDIDWAIGTRPLLLQEIAREQSTEAAQLQDFVRKCHARFA